jgi:hypothetical protein
MPVFYNKRAVHSSKLTIFPYVIDSSVFFQQLLCVFKDLLADRAICYNARRQTAG